MRLRVPAPATLAVLLFLPALTGCAHLPFRGRGARTVPAATAVAAPGTASAGAEAPAAAVSAPAPLPADEPGLLARLATSPVDAAALAALARLYYEQARFAEGAELLRVAADRPDAFMSADRARLLAARALLHDALGERAEARDAIARAREASARDANPTALYLELRKPSPEGLATLAHDVERSGARDAVALNNVGIARLRAGDADGARRAFDSAIAREPSRPGPHYNLAILEHWWRHDRDAAARRFAAYWRLSHDDPDGLAAVFSDVVAAAARPETGR
ncbi:MAG: hypothetical protein U0704_12660 [Candidatus Eisenbacteria bacterium]